MKCQLSVCVDIFDTIKLFVRILGEQPGDCKLIFGPIWQSHAELSQYFAIRGYQFSTLGAYLCRSWAMLVKPVIFTHTVLVFHMVSARSHACVKRIKC